MPRRIDIELTSSREDGSWTWRAAGAKAPKGTVPGAVIGDGAKVGDVLKVDAEFFVDGIQVVGVVNATRNRTAPTLLELIAPTRTDEPLVTQTLAPRSRDDRRPRRDGDRRDRPERRDGDRRERPARGDGERGERRGPGPGEGGERRGRPDRARRPRPEAPPVPVIERPKAKRLRAGRTHRNALLESLAEEQRPIAEQVVLGGLPAVRQAIEKQNAERAAAGEPAIAAGPLLELAEKLVPKVRAAEWRDRADAAQKDLEVIDLRDLRSVVSAADGGPKDDESRALAKVLKDGLAARVDAEHALWLTELNATLDVGRIVRALRLSSRPPKAGAPLPPEVAERLTSQTSEALTADAAPERWVAVLDALAFAPVRDKVIPASLPAELHADVRSTIARLATRIPKVAHIFEIAPDRNAPRPKPERRRPAKKAAPKAARPAKDDAPKGEAPAAEVDAPTGETPAAEVDAPTGETPAAEAEAPTTDAPVVEVEATPPADAAPAPEEAVAQADATPDGGADADPEPGPGTEAVPEPQVAAEATPDADAPDAEADA